MRSSAGSASSSCASTSTSRSTRYTASVMRNEQAYATPPGALFVYTPVTAQCAASMSYEPVKTWKNPAGYFVGWAVPLNAPWSASTLTRMARMRPSRVAAISPCMWKSRAKLVLMRFSERSSIHFTGLPVTTAQT